MNKHRGLKKITEQGESKDGVHSRFLQKDDT